MTSKKLLTGLLAVLLAACTLRPTPGTATGTDTGTRTPTLPPGVTPSVTPSPTFTPSPTPIPQVRLKTGDEAFFNGDYDGALYEYQNAFASSSDPQIRSTALWGQGRVYLVVGNNGRALEILDQLTADYPSTTYAARAYYLLGEIYMTMEHYPDAAQAFTTYLTQRPGVVDTYVQEQRGEAYADSANYSEAIQAYRAALAAPHIGDDTSIQIKIAQAYASSGDSTTALGMYSSIAAASSNDFTKAQMDLLSGQLYLSIGQSQQAYQVFGHAVDNYPLSYDSYSALVALVNAGVVVDDLNRGLVDYYAGQYGYALDAFQRYIVANPKNDGTAVYYKALTLYNLGQYQDAILSWDTFIQNYPDNAHWAAAWGGDIFLPGRAFTQWYWLGQYDLAAQTLFTFITQAPTDPNAPIYLMDAASIQERGGKLEDAAKTWERVVDEYPASDLVPQALFSAGIARYRNGSYSQALVTFGRDFLLSTDVDYQARASFWVGKTQQALGDAATAKATWQQAATLDPTNYYSLRSQDMLFNRVPFAPVISPNLSIDLPSERAQAEAWLRVTFKLPPDTDLSTAGDLLSDPRLVRGAELWSLGLQDEARLEFEDLRTSVQNDPVECFRLANYLLDLGLYRSAINAARQVLTLAGMGTQAQTLAAPIYFNHIRYGLYYQDVIDQTARQSGFDPLFLFSVVRQESLFEGFVRSTAGARGLMQILPSTGQEIANNFGWPPNFTTDDLYRPLVSINLGANYLMTNRDRLNGDLYATLAAYNAGAVREEAWKDLSGNDQDLFLEVIRLQEPGDYIRSIYEIYGMYRLFYSTSP